MTPDSQNESRRSKVVESCSQCGLNSGVSVSPSVVAIANAWPHLRPHIQETILTLIDMATRPAPGGLPQ
jgi:hypothetical protein